MPQRVFLDYNKALDLIEEADILLFRGDGLISRLIERAGEGNYSHVGLATWHNGGIKKKDDSSVLEVTEFREGYGGRTVNLVTAYHDDILNKRIDVYRVTSPLYKAYFDSSTNQVKRYSVDFDSKGITRFLRSLTGLPYGWSRIWWILKNKLTLRRLFYNTTKISDDSLIIDHHKIFPVCSTAVAASFSKFGYDLTPNRADEWMEPSDLSRSAILNYLFTLTLDASLSSATITKSKENDTEKMIEGLDKQD